MQNGTLSFDESLFNSRLSFRSLLTALKKNIAEGNPGVQKLYGGVVAEFESHPELMQDIDDLSILTPYTELIEELLASIFPPTSSSHENLYAVGLPFKFQTVYTSKLFHHLFIKPGTNEIKVPDDATGLKLNKEKLEFAYGMILKKYCGYNSPETSGWIHPYKDLHTGLTKYLELKIDTRFIDVKPVGELSKMPESILCQRTNRIKTIEELTEHIDLKQFVFEGLSIFKVNDVTEQEVISMIKNSLLNINGFSDATVYPELEAHIQSLLGLKDVRIGVTPFFKVNGHYVYSDLHNNNSILFKHFHSSEEKDEVSDGCQHVFKESDRPVVFEIL